MQETPIKEGLPIKELRKNGFHDPQAKALLQEVARSMRGLMLLTSGPTPHENSALEAVRQRTDKYQRMYRHYRDK